MCVGIRGMNSSCPSLSRHLNSVDVTFRNSPVLVCELVYTWKALFSTVSEPSGLDCLLPWEKQPDSGLEARVMGWKWWFSDSREFCVLPRTTIHEF